MVNVCRMKDMSYMNELCEWPLLTARGLSNRHSEAWTNAPGHRPTTFLYCSFAYLLQTQSWSRVRSPGEGFTPELTVLFTEKLSKFAQQTLSGYTRTTDIQQCTVLYCSECVSIAHSVSETQYRTEALTPGSRDKTLEPRRLERSRHSQRSQVNWSTESERKVRVRWVRVWMQFLYSYRAETSSIFALHQRTCKIACSRLEQIII